MQYKCLMALLRNRDTMLQAQAGTGKTTGCLIAVLQLLDLQLPHCQALVVCPTREIANRAKRTVEQLGKFLGVECALLVGGRNLREDIVRLTT